MDALSDDYSAKKPFSGPLLIAKAPRGLRKPTHPPRPKPYPYGPHVRPTARLYSLWIRGNNDKLYSTAHALQHIIIALAQRFATRLKNEVLPGLEPGSLDSESRVLTITP